jgi:hypothetical protein
MVVMKLGRPDRQETLTLKDIRLGNGVAFSPDSKRTATAVNNDRR